MPRAFDAMPALAVRSRTGANVGGTGATYTWALDDPQDIRRLEPKLALVEAYRTSQRIGYSRFGFLLRATIRTLELFAAQRRYEQILVYRF